MYQGFLRRAQDSMSAVTRHLRTSNALRSMLWDDPGQSPEIARLFIDPPNSVEWRIIDQSAAVSRIYAIYEGFVHELIRDYVSVLERVVEFEKLDASFTTAYRLGVSSMLKKIDHNRYSHISLPNLVESYAEALSGASSYRLVSDALLTHERNLQMPDLVTVFSTVGIGGIDKWVENHQAIMDFFGEKDRLGANASSELKLLVQSRNDAAHGGLSIDDLTGLEQLIEYVDFGMALAEALADRVQLAVIDASIAKGYSIELGTATEVIKHRMVAIGALKGTIETEGTIYFCGNGFCFENQIASIQIDDLDVTGVSLLEPVEVGIRFLKPCKKGARLISFRSPKIPAAEEPVESEVTEEMDGLSAAPQADMGA